MGSGGWGWGSEGSGGSGKWRGARCVVDMALAVLLTVLFTVYCCIL